MSIITIIEMYHKKGWHYTVDKITPLYNKAVKQDDKMYIEYYKSILYILFAGYNKKMTIELLSQIGV